MEINSDIPEQINITPIQAQNLQWEQDMMPGELDVFDWTKNVPPLTL